VNKESAQKEHWANTRINGISNYGNKQAEQTSMLKKLNPNLGIFL